MQRLASLVEDLATLIPTDRPVVYLDYPVHMNVGDLLIEAGTERFLEIFAYEVIERRSAYDFGRSARRRVSPDATILLHGGGNFGDLYDLHQRFRERVVAAYPNHRIVMLPQSLHYESETAMARTAEIFARHDNLHICLRDKPSLAIVQRHFRNPASLFPDMAHLLWQDFAAARGRLRGEETLLFARRDKENAKLPGVAPGARAYDWKDLISLPQKAAYYSLIELHRSRGPSGGLFSLHPLWRLFRNNVIARSVRFLSDYDDIVSNRLHMAILGLLLGRQVTMADNSYGKLSRYHEAWLSDNPDARVVA